MTVFGDFTAARPLLLVGCGRMGSAMLAGWLERGLKADAVRIVDPAADQVRAHFPNLGADAVAADVEALPADLAPSVVVLAIKPQMMDGTLATIADRLRGKALVVSIAAGKPIASFAAVLGASCPIVRAMPNTPAAIGKGMTVAVANDSVSDAEREVTAALLSAVGAFAWIEDEAQMDAVTAVSGSGPAYVFYFAECLARAGAAAGLPADLAHTLATETVSGAGALLAETGEDPARLRENVTSPGGTTAAALEVLMRDPGLTDLLEEAVAAATRRGRELAG